jgi:hypothetical protein
MWGFFCALTAACSCASCSSHAARIMTGPIRITSPVIISRRAPDSKKNKNNFWWNENCFLTLVKQTQKTQEMENLTEIKVGSFVLVPEPNDSDIHNNEFLGVVVGFKGEYVIVEDSDGDCFDIEIERLGQE